VHSSHYAVLLKRLLEWRVDFNFPHQDAKLANIKVLGSNVHPCVMESTPYGKIIIISALCVFLCSFIGIALLKVSSLSTLLSIRTA
jgi:hypothetical protein